MTLAVIITVVLLAIALGFVYRFWSKLQSSESDKLLLEVQLKNKDKKKKQKPKKEFDHPDLGLATTKQIIDELRKRPNNRFLMLIPHQKSEDIFVETHICNIAPEAVLMMLKVAYDGVSEAWDEGDDDWEIED